MTILEMLEQSAILSVLGMAVVFIFLWIMTIFIDLTGKIINAAGGKKESAQSETKLPEKAGTVKPQIIAAITAAITEHQKKEKGL